MKVTSRARTRTTAAPQTAAPRSLTEEIAELARVLREFDLHEIEVERSSERVWLRREPPGGARSSTASLGPTTPAPAHLGPPAAAPPATPTTATETAPPPHGTIYITAPFVGTFYRQPSPNAPPFVEVAQRVKKGQVLCIIEAMKLMNEIEAELDGTIIGIMPVNAQPVEFGEPLFQLQP